MTPAGLATRLLAAALVVAAGVATARHVQNRALSGDAAVLLSILGTEAEGLLRGTTPGPDAMPFDGVLASAGDVPVTALSRGRASAAAAGEGRPCPLVSPFGGCLLVDVVLVRPGRPDDTGRAWPHPGSERAHVDLRYRMFGLTRGACRAMLRRLKPGELAPLAEAVVERVAADGPGGSHALRGPDAPDGSPAGRLCGRAAGWRGPVTLTIDARAS